MVLECAGAAQSDATLLHLRFDEQVERLKWWAFLENNWEKVWYWMKNEDFGSNIFQQGTIAEVEGGISSVDEAYQLIPSQKEDENGYEIEASEEIMYVMESLLKDKLSSVTFVNHYNHILYVKLCFDNTFSVEQDMKFD
ncbi:hypothetical protein POTOM_037382 [Populus tomentosa]|uniref:Uncharacterized protein n=1 Tax=Populus tomentosa TaxID=118781 RepID=A0A8X7YUL0_POPTO|nr:hypothetical protein POTOM_037382 [Populus tomentosa]